MESITDCETQHTHMPTTSVVEEAVGNTAQPLHPAVFSVLDEVLCRVTHIHSPRPEIILSLFMQLRQIHRACSCCGNWPISGRCIEERLQ